MGFLIRNVTPCILLLSAGVLSANSETELRQALSRRRLPGDNDPPLLQAAKPYEASDVVKAVFFTRICVMFGAIIGYVYVPWVGAVLFGVFALSFAIEELCIWLAALAKANSG